MCPRKPNEIAKIDKKAQVVKASLEVFLKYGYRRITMGELADAAGISRPALYLLFDKKEEIFNAVVSHSAQIRLEEAKKGLALVKSPEKQLRFVFEVWVVQPFDWIQRSPEAKELIDGTLDFAQEALARNYAKLESLLIPIIQAHPKKSLPPGLSAPEIARTFTGAVRGFKQVAQTSAELRKMIETLLCMTLG